MADETKKDEPAKITYTGRRINDEPSPAPSKPTISSKVKESGTTAGKGLGLAGKGGSGMPKQEAGESASAYGARLRKWREENDMETQARQKALSPKK